MICEDQRAGFSCLVRFVQHYRKFFGLSVFKDKGNKDFIKPPGKIFVVLAGLLIPQERGKGKGRRP